MAFPTMGALGWKPWFHPPYASTRQLNDPGPVTYDLSVPWFWHLVKEAATWILLSPIEGKRSDRLILHIVIIDWFSVSS